MIIVKTQPNCQKVAVLACHQIDNNNAKGKVTRMVMISDYEMIKKGRKTYIRSNEKLTCPLCEGELKPIGSRRRKVKMPDSQEKHCLVIRRLRCQNANCWTIHHELPDILVPFKRYGRETIEKIINTDEAADPL